MFFSLTIYRQYTFTIRGFAHSHPPPHTRHLFLKNYATPSTKSGILHCIGFIASKPVDEKDIFCIVPMLCYIKCLSYALHSVLYSVPSFYIVAKLCFVSCVLYHFFFPLIDRVSSCFTDIACGLAAFLVTAFICICIMIF